MVAPLRRTPAPVVLPAEFLQRFPAIRALPDAGRGMGLFVLGTRGAGKSRLLGRLVAYQDLLRGVPLVVVDPIGGLIDNLLDKLTYLPAAIQERLWPRLRYVNMNGADGRVIPWPDAYRGEVRPAVTELQKARLSSRIADGPTMLRSASFVLPPTLTAALTDHPAAAAVVSAAGLSVSIVGSLAQARVAKTAAMQKKPYAFLFIAKSELQPRAPMSLWVIGQRLGRGEATVEQARCKAGRFHGLRVLSQATIK